MEPGTTVFIKHNDHPSGLFIANHRGYGIVIADNDLMSREKGNVVVDFGGLVVRYPETALRDGTIERTGFERESNINYLSF